MQIKDMFRKKIDREIQGVITVSYTHLDVYKRQCSWRSMESRVMQS